MATAAPNPLASGDTAYLYRAAIGPRGQDYYLRHFARFDGEGKTGASWNWAAYWTTFNWLVYRKMWGWALAYVAALSGLALLVFGVGKLVLNYSDTSAILVSLLLLTLAFVVPGLYANGWFYTHCNEKITAALRQTPDLKQAATALAAEAPDNRRLLLLALGNAALLAFALVLAHGLQSSDSALPQLAAREDRASAAGRLEAPANPPAATASVPAAPAPLAVASAPAPAPVASAPQPAPAAAPVLAEAAPARAASASAPAAAPAPITALPAATVPPAAPKVQVADRATPAPPRREAAPAARAAASNPAPAVAAPRAPAASAPVARRYVWVIQVGAYAQEENARKALAQVQALGLEAGAETFGSVPLTRVRVGPFTREAEAEQAALRIKSLDLPVLVIRQRP